MQEETIEEIENIEIDKDVVCYLLLDASVMQVPAAYDCLKEYSESAILSLWDKVEKKGKSMEVNFIQLQSVPLEEYGITSREQFSRILSEAGPDWYGVDHTVCTIDSTAFYRIVERVRGMERENVSLNILWATDGVPIWEDGDDRREFGDSDGFWSVNRKERNPEQLIGELLDFGSKISIAMVYNNAWGSMGAAYPFALVGKDFTFDTWDWRNIPNRQYAYDGRYKQIRCS